MLAYTVQFLWWLGDNSVKTMLLENVDHTAFQDGITLKLRCTGVYICVYVCGEGRELTNLFQIH